MVKVHIINTLVSFTIGLAGVSIIDLCKQKQKQTKSDIPKNELSKQLLDKLSKIYNDHQNKQYEDSELIVKSKVPQHVFDRIPKELVIEFNDAIQNSPHEHSFAAFYGIKFLNKLKKDDEILIKWLADYYGIDLD